MLNQGTEADMPASSVERRQHERTSLCETQWPSNQEAFQSTDNRFETNASQYHVTERNMPQQLEALSTLIDTVCDKATASEQQQQQIAHFDARGLDDLYRRMIGQGISWLVKSAIGRQVSTKNFLKALINTYLAREVFKPDTEHSWEMYGAPAWRHIVQLLPSIADEAVARRAYQREIGSVRFQAALSVTADTLAEELASKLHHQLYHSQAAQLNVYTSRQTLFDRFEGLDLVLNHALNVNCMLSSLDGGYEVIWAFPGTPFDPTVMRREGERHAGVDGAVLITTSLGLRQDGRVVSKTTVILTMMETSYSAD